uniref:Ricin B lectin domain-containing protein n=1 Tax=Pseudictyota dubia TaxID=2749911 RepID=A0A7R9ZEE7_9STRA|mmetsp:Transcript_44604/g.82733  ORF Transcript_44604/g.82733 Transcript_44604/m.82733 type:complete len:172 (+) Transcript_44604:114-629(+)
MKHQFVLFVVLILGIVASDKAMLAFAQSCGSKSGPFRIKLYWRQGYRWQGQKSERKWCMQPSNKYVRIFKCSKSSSQKWIYENCQIKTANGRKCLTQGSRSKWLTVESCSGSNRQKWDWIGANSIGGYEIYPKGSKSKCVTQLHHPRKNEKLFLQRCSTAAKHKTSKWNKY